MTAPALTPRALTNTAAKPEHNTAIGYLRAFVIVLVIAHHAALAYHPYAPPLRPSLVPRPHMWEAFPVVDSQRSNLFALLVGFNDVFFMSLLFFLSGLFVWNSIERKGAAAFLRDRLRRLGIPFLASALFLAPLAYYPAFLQTRAPGGLPAFVQQWLSLGEWPAGPAWFLWVLFVFDCLAAALFLGAPKVIDALGRLASNLARRPVALFAGLVAVSAAVYVPLSLVFNPMIWSAFGPFTFQTSRILHYFAYFLIAVALGAYLNASGLFSPESKLRRRWPLWTIAALFAFFLYSAVVIAMLTSHLGSTPWAMFANFNFSLSCAASCFALLALFLRFANARRRFLDNLSDNSYGIYLLHYFCVSWLQYALLSAPLPALGKFAIVVAGALGLSWIASALLRRIRVVARVV